MSLLYIVYSVKINYYYLLLLLLLFIYYSDMFQSMNT